MAVIHWTILRVRKVQSYISVAVSRTLANSSAEHSYTVDIYT